MRRRQRGWFVAALLVALAGAEIGARLLDPSLPPPEMWPDATTSLKVDQMDDRPCADVVIVGNSMARDALDPQILRVADSAQRSVYNAALDGATPAQVRAWVAHEVAPRLDPEVVVIALSSIDLNDESRIGNAALAAYESSPGGRRDPLGRVNRVAGAHSALVRHRAVLRQPDQVVGAIRTGAPDNASASALINNDGLGLSRRELTYAGDTVSQALLRQDLLNGFSIGGRQTTALDALLGEVTEDFDEALLVILPVTPEYIEAHPAGVSDFDSFRQSVVTAATRHDIGLLNLSAEEFGRELFADTHHLNAAGSALASQLVGEALPASPGACDA